MLISQGHFDGPSRAHGPSEANGFPEAHGLPHGPRGHCTPCPPLGGPGSSILID